MVQFPMECQDEDDYELEIIIVFMGSLLLPLLSIGIVLHKNWA